MVEPRPAAGHALRRHAGHAGQGDERVLGPHAQAHRPDVRLPPQGPDDRGHGVAVVDEAGVRAHPVAVGGDRDHGRDHAHGSRHAARPHRVAHRLVDPELARHEDVLLPGPAAADPDGADHDRGAVEDVLALDGGGDLRRPVRDAHEAPDHLLGGLEDHGVDVDEGDLPVAFGLLLDPVDDDALREHGAAGADQDHLLLRGLRLVPGHGDVARARPGGPAPGAGGDAAQGSCRRDRHQTLNCAASIHVASSRCTLALRAALSRGPGGLYTRSGRCGCGGGGAALLYRLARLRTRGASARLPPRKNDGSEPSGGGPIAGRGPEGAAGAREPPGPKGAMARRSSIASPFSDARVGGGSGLERDRGAVDRAVFDGSRWIEAHEARQSLDRAGELVLPPAGT